MHRVRQVWLAVAVCLSFVPAMNAQTRTPSENRTVELSPNTTRPVAPDSPAAASSAASGSQAIVPRLMKFSGVLADSAGKPLSGAVDVTFSLFAAETGGAPLWFETQSVQADELGRYTALLGAMHTDGLPLDLFTSGEVRWLGIQVGLEPEQQPRVLLVSVPYALKAGDAETLGGKPASAYMLNDSQGTTSPAATTSSSTTGTTQTGTNNKTSSTHAANTSALTACSAVTSDGTAVASAIAMFTTACNIEGSNMYQSSGNIGIGTASPQALLDVENGTMRLGRTGTWPVIFNQTGGSVFTITNGGTHQLAFDPNGNLGVGTGAPAARLDVENGDLRIARTGTWPVVMDQSAGSIFTITNGSGKMTLGYNGNLGLGTLVPAHSLEVHGPNYSLGGFMNSGTGTDHTALIDIQNGDATLWRYGVGGTGNGLGLTNGQFYIERNGIGARMLIDTFGNVGIGQTSPYSVLHVRQDFSGALGAAITLMNGGGGSGAAVSLDMDTYDTGANAPSSRILSIDDGNSSNNITFLTKTPGAQTNSLVEQVRISDYGSLIVDSSHNNTGSLSTSATAGTALAFGGAGSGEGIGSDRGTSNGQQYSLNFYTGFTQRMLIQNSGGVTMNYGLGVSNANTVSGNSLVVNGNAAITGCLSVSGSSSGTCVSDSRLKTNIQPFQPVLNRLVQLHPVHFNWRPTNPPDYRFGNQLNTGLIAQEVERAFPDMVSVNADGYRQVHYGELPFLLLEGVRELKAQNDSLKMRLHREEAQIREARGQDEAQQAEIQKLRAEVRQLRQGQISTAALEERLARIEKRLGEDYVAAASNPISRKATPSGAAHSRP